MDSRWMGSRMQLLTGRYNAKFDDKGRLSLPARLRAALATEQVVVLPGLEGNHMMVMSQDYFEEEFSGPILSSPMAVLDKKKRNFLRMLLGSACDLQIDSAGRINIPQAMRTPFSLPNKSEVVIVGAGRYIELWNPEILSKEEDETPDLATLAQEVYKEARNGD